MFECSKCGLHATVSGRTEQGLTFAVETIVCVECKKLYDAVTQLRVANESGLWIKNAGRGLNEPQLKTLLRRPLPQTPPTLMAALNRLPIPSLRDTRWVRYRPRCPVSPLHRVEPWSSPGKCPRCGAVLDQNAIPFRVWE